MKDKKRTTAQRFSQLETAFTKMWIKQEVLQEIVEKLHNQLNPSEEAKPKEEE